VALGLVGLGLAAVAALIGQADLPLQPPTDPQAGAAVALPGPDEVTVPDGRLEGDANGERSRSASRDGASDVPSCFGPDGEICGAILLPGGDAADAVRATFGVVVVGPDLTVRRLQATDTEPLERWRTDLGARAGADPHPGDHPVHLGLSGTRLFVSSPTHLHVLDVSSGDPQWLRRLRTGRSDASPWHAWQAGEHVIAVSDGVVVALDGDDGRLRWSLLRPDHGIQAHRDGVAILADSELSFHTPDAVAPAWTVTAPRAARLAQPLPGATGGPVVVTGDPTLLLAAEDGRVLADLGADASATRTAGGQVVAAVWPEGGRISTLIGFGADGQERWRRVGPTDACCRLTLRPLEDGSVLAIRAGAAGQETGWVLSPSTGEVLQRLTRPADTARIPVAVTEDTAVWLDGSAYLAAAPDGTIRWRAESQARLLSSRPLLVATREGLMAPSTEAAE